MNDFWKNIFAFAVICVTILGAIGGTAYLFYDGHALFGVANICLTAMAFPFIKKVVKEFIA